ncbi:MAG: hypothetical protein GW892_28775, partial [Armatimonadetes bacterium]|nr:hypothetical protein [Armatimonadota bacterium]
GLDELFTLAVDMADGLHAHEAEVGLTHNTEAMVREALAAAQEAQVAFQTVRSDKTRLTAAQTVADSNARAFLSAARGVLANFLGSTWSQAWQPTGFPNQSTAVPTTAADRQALLSSLQTYFTSHPEHQIEQLNVTAARAEVLFTTLSAARTAVNAGLAASGAKKAARDAAETTLRHRLRAVIDELSLLLPPDDPRWYAFGLLPPVAPDTPDPPNPSS